LPRLRLETLCSIGATSAPGAVFSEQDDQKNDQENETADTDIHGFSPDCLGLGNVTIAVGAKFRSQQPVTVAEP
jgi:hypothetical protein